jgi:hypothetical protein
VVATDRDWATLQTDQVHALGFPTYGRAFVPALRGKIDPALEAIAQAVEIDHPSVIGPRSVTGHQAVTAPRLATDPVSEIDRAVETDPARAIDLESETGRGSETDRELGIGQEPAIAPLGLTGPDGQTVQAMVVGIGREDPTGATVRGRGTVRAIDQSLVVPAGPVEVFISVTTTGSTSTVPAGDGEAIGIARGGDITTTTGTTATGTVIGVTAGTFRLLRGESARSGAAGDMERHTTTRTTSSKRLRPTTTRSRSSSTTTCPPMQRQRPATPSTRNSRRASMRLTKD